MSRMPAAGNVSKIALLSKRITEFERSSKPLAFTGRFMTRSAIGDQLRERLKNPAKINQGNTPLCGPAAFLYWIAKEQKKAYVNYIIDLCELGHARLGHLKVKPSKDCLRSSPKEMTYQCDWVGLASLRDSANDIFSVTPGENSISGITLPNTLASWFQQAGYDPVINSTNLIIDKTLANLVKADHLAGSQAVALLVNARTILNRGLVRIPDHWIVPTSKILIDGKPASGALKVLRSAESPMLQAQIDRPSAAAQIRKWAKIEPILSAKITFTYYSWGQADRRVNHHRPNLTLADFLCGFYGFVSAKNGRFDA